MPLAAKLITLLPRNAGTHWPTHQGVIAVFARDNGHPTALLDSTAITAIRTGAGSALATRLLAREAAATVAILGTGVQARSHARAVTRVREFRELRVAGRDRAKAAALAEELGAELNLAVRAAASWEACDGADVICATAHALEPEVRRAWVSPGTHVTSVGYNPQGREVDDAIVVDSLVARPPGRRPPFAAARVGALPGAAAARPRPNPHVGVPGVRGKKPPPGDANGCMENGYAGAPAANGRVHALPRRLGSAMRDGVPSPPEPVRGRRSGRRVDPEALERAAQDLVAALGADPSDERFRDTPRRVAKAYVELLSPEPFDATSFPNDGGYDELVVVREIPFHSLCEHHLLPFVGVAHVGYLPGERIVGLSKLARVVDYFARDLQVQERLTTQIAGWFEEELSPRGVGVVLEAEHMCMAVRGVTKPGARTVTSALHGRVREDSRTRQEFLELTRHGQRG